MPMPTATLTPTILTLLEGAQHEHTAQGSSKPSNPRNPDILSIPRAKNVSNTKGANSSKLNTVKVNPPAAPAVPIRAPESRERNQIQKASTEPVRRLVNHRDQVGTTTKISEKPRKHKKVSVPRAPRAVTSVNVGVERAISPLGRFPALERALKDIETSSGIQTWYEPFDLVLSAARATISILRRHGLSSAVVGSLACKLYGSPRCPNDVDLLVLQPSLSHPVVPIRTAEQIKALIVNKQPGHFYLKHPRNPTAPYRILYYREGFHSCKVDILLPGIMHLPSIPLPSPSSSTSQNLATGTASSSNYLRTISGIPLAPFSLLLVFKLQAWDDHRHAPEEFKRRKQHQDATDLQQLFALDDAIEVLQHTQPWTDTNLFSLELQELTRERVRQFCTLFPSRAPSWQSLGFDTKPQTRFNYNSPWSGMILSN